MLRRSSLALLALCALAGCQDYNFNPVGKCVIQPGSSRIQLSGQATADILFVVDDSGSMNPEQARLAANFKSFLAALAAAQQDRQSQGLEPFEFHIAVTTSSIFESWKPGQPASCTGSPLTCNIQYPVLRGGQTSPPPPYSVACQDSGAACNDVEHTFVVSSSCVAGTATATAPYPNGSFVAAPGNPAVLHFTKDIWAGTPDAAAKLAQLQDQFQKNIAVGSCGSGMEQHFEASKLAVEKALAGKQPGVTADEWPHAGAKLVVVWLGDEDDCSNPDDPTRSLAFDFLSNLPGKDVCVADQTSATPKQFALDRYASFFTSLNRPFGAAFIYSADQTSCKDDGNGNRICTPGTCTCQCPATCTGGCGIGSAYTGECKLGNTSSDVCGGQIPPIPAGNGSRFATLSTLFRKQGVNTFEASVCDANWGTTLQGIAQLVKPPPGLTLPTQPASSQVALLRIESADGKTSRYCTGPAQSQAELTTADWWFIDCKTGAPVLSGTTSCITINHATKHCEPNPGESYIAQYLGIVPSPSVANPTGGCSLVAGHEDDCKNALGGSRQDWSCTPVTSTFGTCTCNTTAQVQ